MNRNDHAQGIEARLHRSLMGQVRAPRLDRGFDAAVWARIEAEELPQTGRVQAEAPTSNATRWLMASNVIGLAVAASLVMVFGLNLFGGAAAGSSLPEISAAQSRQIADIVTWTVTGASMLFGLMFTPLGRWLRSELT
jgi:hypothetical protein